MSRLTLSVDDGCSSDIRVADLARKYNIKLVIYIPAAWHYYAKSKGFSPLRASQIEELSREFEIGSHTITHRHLTKIPLEEAKQEIKDSKEMLEKMFDTKITKFCPPRGYTNPELTEYTLSIYESQRLTKGEGLVHIHPDSGANGNVHWLEYAKGIEVKELWCHSWELNRYPEEWDNLEKYLKENR